MRLFACFISTHHTRKAHRYEMEHPCCQLGKLAMPRFTKENAATYGRRGGLSTVSRHGREHMSHIGVRGFWRTVERHWNGNPRPFVNYFIALGIAATDPVPQNGAFTHDRRLLRIRAEVGTLNYVRPYWKPPRIPDDLDIEPPF